MAQVSNTLLYSLKGIDQKQFQNVDLSKVQNLGISIFMKMIESLTN